eukprot:555816-Amphidinium_carterae.1
MYTGGCAGVTFRNFLGATPLSARWKVFAASSVEKELRTSQVGRGGPIFVSSVVFPSVVRPRRPSQLVEPFLLDGAEASQVRPRRAASHARLAALAELPLLREAQEPQVGPGEPASRGPRSLLEAQQPQVGPGWPAGVGRSASLPCDDGG